MRVFLGGLNVGLNPFMLCGMVRFLITLCFVAFAMPGWAAEKARLSFGGEVTGMARVLDGDTYMIDGVRWREHGIDAPEMSEARGPVARAALDELVAGQPITCIYYGRDRHRRNVGECISTSGRMLGREMLLGGWAFVHRLYVSDGLAASYDEAEAEARTAGRGFWEKQQTNVTHNWIEIAQGLAPLLAVLVVALAALFTWLIRRWERNQERQALASAIASEISATIAIVDRRGHVETGQHYIKLLREGQDIEMPRIGDPDVMPQDFIKSYPVFQANVGKVGILGAEAAAEIAIFYTQTIGVAASLRDWARGGWDDAAPEIKASAIEEELAMWEEARTIGLKLCAHTLNHHRK